MNIEMLIKYRLPFFRIKIKYPIYIDIAEVQPTVQNVTFLVFHHAYKVNANSQFSSARDQYNVVYNDLLTVSSCLSTFKNTFRREEWKGSMHGCISSATGMRANF